MPDNYDYTTDPDFLSAPATEQHAYLMANDPEYAKTDPKTQGAYIAHLRGYDQPTQFEQQNAPQQSQGGTLLRTAEGVGRGLNNLVEGTYQTLFHPINTAKGVISNAQQAYQQGQQEPSTIGKVAAYSSGLPFLGPLGKSLGQRAAGGDVAGSIAEGLTTAAGPSVAREAVGRGVPAARSAIADASYDENGKLKAIPHFASKLAGAGAGEATGIPYGGLMGWLGGSELYKTLFPDRLAEQRKIGANMARGYRNMGNEPAASGSPHPETVPSEPEVSYWQEGAPPQTRGSQAWSLQRTQSPELQQAARAGDPDAQTVMQRLGKKGIIIPKGSELPWMRGK